MADITLVPQEIRPGVHISGNKIYVLANYRSNPLFLSFRKSYECVAGKIEVIISSAEELQTLSTSTGQNEASNSAIINIYKKLFAAAAAQRASDIHMVVFNEGYTNVYLRVHGKLVMYNQYTFDEGRAVMRSIYQNISMSDTSYIDNDYQSGQIHSFDDSKSLPEAVSSIRIQRGPMLNGYWMVLRLLYNEEKKAGRSKKIGQMLLKSKLITEKTLDVALGIQRELKNKGQNIRLGEVLVSNNFVNKRDIEEVLFKQKGSLDLGLKIFQDYGYTYEQALILAKAARQPSGMVLFSGPTGSGKSTALKIALEFQAQMYPDKAIYSIEDPPEYPIFGAKQLPVLNANTDEKRESKFAEGLRVAMRSDPDILMVGEIRDEATANVAMDAVITGHQMWSTIHAADVFAILLRLTRLGLNQSDLYDEKLLNVLVGQRLLPRLCDGCKRDFSRDIIDNDLADILDPLSGYIKLRNETGCPKCNHTGITGRVVVAEVLDVTEELLHDIKELGLPEVRREWSNKGLTMINHAVERMVKGEVDPLDIVATVSDIQKKNINYFAEGGYVRQV